VYDRKRQTDRGAQRQMVDLFERRHAKDRCIAVGAWMAGLAGFLSVAPSRDQVIANPEGETSALHERGVIVFPVAEMIGAFGFLGLHTSRIPALSSPCFMQQSRLQLLKRIGISPKVTMLDPWYNKGFGGIRNDYKEFVIDLMRAAADISDHIFLWGFPEIIAYFVDKLPEPLKLVAWLTWYYKNNPSVIRGWRSSQNAC